MATTREEVQDEVVRVLSAERPVQPPLRVRLDRPISGRMAAFVGASWAVLFPVAMLIERASANPEAAVPLWASAIVLAWSLSIVAMVVGLGANKRRGLASSLGAGVILLAMTIECIASGHHMFATWWLGQLAISTSLVGVSVASLRRS